VPRQGEAERRLLLGQLLLQVPRLGRDQRAFGPAGVAGVSEQALLGRLALALLCRFEGAPGSGEQAGAVGLQSVEGAGADQRFDRAAVDRALVHPPA
jgi:hypothetical protein